VTAVAIVFWVSAGLLIYAQVGYALLLAVIAGVARGRSTAVGTGDPPSVTVIVAAYAEEAVIAERVHNLKQLAYPHDRLQVIVACDGSPDATAERARSAGADLVLELPRGGKIRAQDQAVERADGEIVAFSDANALWDPDALTNLTAPFSDSKVGYVCGSVRFVNDRGTNQEGLYWRYEMWIRGLESRLRSVTGGNGAIYATRKDEYFVVDPIMGHDLSFPFNFVKRGWRAVYAPDARAVEKMVPTIEGEFARKRRMMSHGWPIVLKGGMLSPKGYDPLYALMIFSHRILRYASPVLHVIALLANIALIGHGWFYVVTLAAQLILIAAALLAPVIPAKPMLVARYYVLTTASLAAGLWDWLAHGTQAGWEPAEGTR
jgi:cellulose synthase/poly-beta-1,6-N-acetylglucosamine synthase-like glycosyltransferase